jgi:hypothetical protein
MLCPPIPNFGSPAIRFQAASRPSYFLIDRGDCRFAEVMAEGGAWLMMLAAGNSSRLCSQVVESPITRLRGLEADAQGSWESDFRG